MFWKQVVEFFAFFTRLSFTSICLGPKFRLFNKIDQINTRKVIIYKKNHGLFLTQNLQRVSLFVSKNYFLFSTNDNEVQGYYE